MQELIELHPHAAITAIAAVACSSTGATRGSTSSVDLESAERSTDIGEPDDEVNEEDFLTALNSNNNSPDIPEELAKLSCSTPVALDDGLGPLPAIKKSSSRTPSRRVSRSSRASTPAAASPNHSYNLRNRPDIFVLKHESSIFRSFIQPGLVCGFSMMEQVML